MTTHFPSILAMLNTLTGLGQRRLLLSYTRGSNSQSYLNTLEALRQRWNDIPDRQPGTKENLAYFHFFNGAADWYIVEKDSDLNEIGQLHASGLIAIEDDEPSHGFINLPEILAGGAELDLYWEPKHLFEITGHCLC